jgi:hypothetical protein
MNMIASIPCAGNLFGKNKNEMPDLSSANPNPPAIMVFECPSSFSTTTSFTNTTNYMVHDHPPAAPQYWSVMRPLRYSCVAGTALPVWVAAPPPSCLIDHWSKAIPDFVPPTLLSGTTHGSLPSILAAAGSAGSIKVNARLIMPP